MMKRTAFAAAFIFVAGNVWAQGATPAQREAAAKGNPKEQPVLVAFRLKLDGQTKIIEAEHLLAGINPTGAWWVPASRLP